LDCRREEDFRPGTCGNRKSLFQVVCEAGFAVHVAVYHLIEVGVGGGGVGWGVRGPELPLNFR
jgi:hypothetical protein